jgi:hypothetical protein
MYGRFESLVSFERKPPSSPVSDLLVSSAWTTGTASGGFETLIRRLAPLRQLVSSRWPASTQRSLSTDFSFDSRLPLEDRATRFKAGRVAPKHQDTLANQGYTTTMLLFFQMMSHRLKLALLQHFQLILRMKRR